MIDRYVLGIDHLYRKPGYRNLEVSFTWSWNVDEFLPTFYNQFHADFISTGVPHFQQWPSCRGFAFMVSCSIWSWRYIKVTDLIFYFCFSFFHDTSEPLLLSSPFLPPPLFFRHCLVQFLQMGSCLANSLGSSISIAILLSPCTSSYASFRFNLLSRSLLLFFYTTSLLLLIVSSNSSCTLSTF